MIVLITGVAGFIGSHTAERLLALGHEVIGVDNFDSFYFRSFKEHNLRDAMAHNSFRFIELDIRDVESVNDVFAKNNIDAVIHLAAKAGVRPSIENVSEYYSVNITGTINILEAMKITNVKNLVFASSSSVYGNNEKVPFSESDRVDQQISPYAATKKSGELLCNVYAHLYGMNISCMRFFTVFGPRQRPDLAIHKFTRLIDRGESLPFYGDGSTARDYTYIEDIVSGLIGALNNLSGYNIFNLGESKVITLHDLITAIECSLNKKALISRLPLQPGDVQRTFADITKSKELLGYNPSFDFQTGINLFVDWYRANHKTLYNEG